MSTENTIPKAHIARLAAVIAEVETAGAEAFSPVLSGSEYVVSVQLVRARAAMAGAVEVLATRARAAFKRTVGGGVARLDCTEQTLRDEVLELNREARRRTRLAA